MVRLGGGPGGPARLLLAAMVLLWALRLGAFLFRRSRGLMVLSIVDDDGAVAAPVARRGARLLRSFSPARAPQASASGTAAELALLRVICTARSVQRCVMSAEGPQQERASSFFW